MLGQTTGNVRVSTSPRLSDGIGENGLVLVRAVVAERDLVTEQVPVKPPGTIPVKVENKRKTRSGPKIPAADQLEGEDFLG